MVELKTRPTDASVADYLSGVTPAHRRDDCAQVVEMMTRITEEAPVMWGTSIIGFGTYRYENTAGKNFEWFLTGVAPRKAALTIYIMPGFKPFPDLMARLGKYRNSVSCLYVTRLSNIDVGVLEDLISQSVDLMRQRYKTG